MICDIAGIRIDIDPIYEMTVSRCEKYAACDDKAADFRVSRNDAVYSSWLRHCGFTDCESSEYIFFGEWFYRAVVTRNAFLLHSSAIAYDGKAVLFSAPPGIGKSTHTAHWKEEFGDRVLFINDDKPLISVRESGVYVSGTPFSGKNDISENMTVPLHSICFLYRAKTNVIEKISQSEGFRLMWLQTIRSMDSERSEIMLSSVRRCAEATDFYVIGCTDSAEAAQTARNAIFGGD